MRLSEFTLLKPMAFGAPLLQTRFFTTTTIIIISTWLELEGSKIIDSSQFGNMRIILVAVEAIVSLEQASLTKY